MAIVTKQRKQQQLLISVLVVVVIVTVGVLFLGGGGDFKIPPAGPPTGGPIIPRVIIPEDLFFDRAFLELVPYDSITLPENIGKTNPFAPK